MKVAFYTLGCKVNQYETQVIQQQFLENGFEVVEPSSEADIYIINSCTVTATGDKKTRQIVHRFKKMNPDAIIVLTGCFPQAYTQDADKIEEADIVTGTRERGSIFGLVQQFIVDRKRVVKVVPHEKGEAFEKMCATKFLERTRAFVKIQDGCNRYCSYCIIPTARGPLRSKALEDIREELSVLAQKGYKEVVLVGINLSLYGNEYGTRLIDAIKAACAVEGIERVRLGSIEPELITDDDLKEMAGLKEFCPQFHLSLQSGCTDTLKRMNRHYTADEYAELVEKIRRAFENPAITTDIMVGFPGEDEREFGESCEFVERVKIAKAHVFAYSRRPNTRADKMPNQVTKSEKESRSRKLIAVCDKVREEVLKTQIGIECEVLFETFDENLGYFGYSENYTPIYVKCGSDPRGEIKKVKIVASYADYCVGELL